MECAGIASSGKKEMASDPYFEHAINAFRFDKSAQTCIVGRIGYEKLGHIPNWPALIEEQDAIYVLQGCHIDGKIF